MTPERLKGIEERNAARTQGVYGATDATDGRFDVRCAVEGEGIEHGYYVFGGIPGQPDTYAANRAFFANAPQDVTDLLAEVRRLADMNDRIANDRILDSDLALEAVRRERQAVLRLLRQFEPRKHMHIGGDYVIGAEDVLQWLAGMIEQGDHLEVKP